MLPYFIAAYKAGNKNVPLPTSMGDGGVSAWYRTTPTNISGCSDGGTTWGQQGSLSAKMGTLDVVNVIAVAAKASTLIVSVGSSSKTLQVPAGPPSFFQVPFGDLAGTGNVTFSMNGQTSQGLAIANECPKPGDVVSIRCTLARGRGVVEALSLTLALFAAQFQRCGSSDCFTSLHKLRWP
jgi:glucan endo-1,3-alpha-glucosidase